MVIAAALRGSKASSGEIDWLRVLYSRFWIKLLRFFQNAQIIRKDFFKVDLSKADIVNLFLLQKTNQKLKNKLEKELKPEAKIISYGFTFDGWKPEKISSQEGQFSSIYLYLNEK